MNTRLILLAALCAAGLARAQRLSPSQIQTALAQGDPVTLIDLRSQTAFARGTLPNALHMSARQALEKGLSGHVVFFDDGLGVNRAKRAAAAFAAAGKSASELAGGFAAWKAAGFATTEAKGLSDRTDRYVTYQDLTGGLLEDAEQVVLVDARETAAAQSPLSAASTDRSTISTSGTGTSAAAIDLAAEFPAYRVTRLGQGSPSAAPAAAEADSAKEPAQPLYVVIDSGDGQAERKAANLRASGCVRVVVLAGGEIIIRRKGASGLVRRGPGTGLSSGSPADASNIATVSEEEVAP